MKTFAGLSGAVSDCRRTTVTYPFNASPSKLRREAAVISIIFVSLFFAQCHKNSDDNVVTPAAANNTAAANDKYTIAQTISDEAQLNTLAFDGLAFLTGSLGAQSFLPPGKVADYSGFQYLRDNDPTSLGHNTDFVTIVAFNVLNILNSDQISLLIARARTQIDLINQFAYKRLPLLKAFRRFKDGDFPAAATILSKSAVMKYLADVYELDGSISYDRASLFGQVIKSLDAEQKSQLDALKIKNGVGNWNRTLADPIGKLKLDSEMSVAVMTYASELYAWYAGTVTSDVYFCPERHGTYFGSFYLKDWPAMGNPNYTINEQLTASAGQQFLNLLDAAQSALIKGLVEKQRSALLELVTQRELISVELRKFISIGSADQSTITALSRRYGELDGEISFYYVSAFVQVYNSLSAEQKSKLLSIAGDLGYVNPAGAFLYSQQVPMPEIINTDFLFE